MAEEKSDNTVKLPEESDYDWNDYKVSNFVSFSSLFIEYIHMGVIKLVV